MARSGGRIVIEGVYSEGVLGAFQIIRGFAPLQDLAEISEAYKLIEPANGAAGVQGFQRMENQQHAQDIKRYLEKGKIKFIPEIILSIRTLLVTELNDKLKGEGLLSLDGISILRKWKDKPIFKVLIERDRISDARKRIRRIDGNHRLLLANELELDPSNPTKYLAPFCFILLGPLDYPNDDYVESMLFHTINSTALPLDSEHALKIILGQAPGLRPTSDEEFANSPPLHLTRLLKTKLDNLPLPQKMRLGKTPATVLFNAAKSMVTANSNIRSDRDEMNQFATDLYGALGDVLGYNPAIPSDLCKMDFFIELATLAWQDSGEGTHIERIARTAKTLEGLGRWLGHDGLTQLCNKQSLAEQLFKLYLTIRQRVPKRIFLARWYPKDSDGSEKRKADLRRNEIQRALDDLEREGIHLVLDDPGTTTGSTFPIHQKMYEALARNDIILIDLSGVRPNVCVEAGYALERHNSGRLLFIFQATAKTPNNPAFSSPPFDLKTFQYEKIEDAAEIPGRIIRHLRTIVEEARNEG